MVDDDDDGGVVVIVVIVVIEYDPEYESGCCWQLHLLLAGHVLSYFPGPLQICLPVLRPPPPLLFVFWP